MTAVLEGGEWSSARPGRTLPPGKTRYPLYRRLGGPQVRSGRPENLVPTEIRSRTVPARSQSYIDRANRPTAIKVHVKNHDLKTKEFKPHSPTTSFSFSVFHCNSPFLADSSVAVRLKYSNFVYS